MALFAHLKFENRAAQLNFRAGADQRFGCTCRAFRLEHDAAAKNGNVEQNGVRVGIASALAGKPRTLLMDEPTGGLDPPTAWSVCELGIRLRDLRDVSAILVTHGIEYVRFMASTYAGYRPNGEVILIEEKDQLCLINTKIMMLREGRIIFDGSDEELFISEDKYIREFLLL